MSRTGSEDQDAIASGRLGHAGHASGETGAEKRSLAGHIANGAGVLTIAALCIGAMVGGTLLLQERAIAEKSATPNPPVKVQTDTISLQSSYRITQSFVGRLEARRETQLAFELPGTVTSVKRDEGDRIAADETIATLDTAKLEARKRELMAQREELGASLALAKATAKRQRTLQRKGWAADQRYDEARFRVLEIDAAIARIDASLQTVNVDLEKSVLKAPFAGRITRRAIDEGAIVASGAPVVGLIQTDNARIRVGLSQTAADKLRIGEDYQFEVSSRGGGRDFVKATLQRLRPDLDSRSRTVTALFEVADTRRLAFGSVVTLVQGQSIDATGAWVPLAALSEGERGLWTILSLKTDDGEQVVRREVVEVLHVNDGRAFVRGSMPDGTRFIVNGINRVTPGQKVAFLRSRSQRRTRPGQSASN